MTSTKPTLSAPHDCTGCGSCAAACPRGSIQMLTNQEGFRYPKINPETCVGCGMCEKACPEQTALTPYTTPENVFAAWAKSDLLRCSSSSGGIFSILAEEVLRQGGVVCGAAMDKEMRLRHIFAATPEELSPIRGSKYVQSSMDGIYPQIKTFLRSGRRVLFSGTPCQVAGLRAYLHNSEEPLLLTIDLVCHGVPSPELLAKVLETQRKKHNGKRIKSCLFREYATWRKNTRLKIIFEDDSVCYDDIYMSAFSKTLSLRPNCYACHYASARRISDITLADFWGIGESVPFAYDTHKGCSMVMLNSQAGKTFWDQQSVRRQCFAVERQTAEALRHNRRLSTLMKVPEAREKFYLDFFSMPESLFIRSYHLKPSFLQWILQYPRRIAGRLRREIRRRFIK